MKLLIIIATVLGITFSTGPEEIPTSLCHDPLLGPTAIIYSDCGGSLGESNKEQSDEDEQLARLPSESQVEQLLEPPIELLSNQLTERLAEPPIEPLPGHSTDDPKTKKEICNKGSGNSSEGCDPGNHPEKGNNDEGGDRHPQNGKPDKSEKTKCNKGSGNGGEGCDPGNHPENGNNDEGGDRHPQNSKKNKEN